MHWKHDRPRITRSSTCFVLQDGENITNERFTEYVVKKDEEDKGPQEITWGACSSESCCVCSCSACILPGDPNAKTPEGEPDPKLSREWHYPKDWMTGELPERSVYGGPIWEFEFQTSVKANILARRQIAEEVLGWEFAEGELELLG